MINGEKILEIFYAEPRKSDRMLFEAALDEIQQPHKLTMAFDGNETMQVLNADSYTPDIVFLDLQMPLKTGNECLAELRNNDKYRDTPVIIFSSSVSDSDVEEAYKLKANLYVQKPFGILEQTEVMKKILTLDWKKYGVQPPKEKFLYNH